MKGFLICYVLVSYLNGMAQPVERGPHQGQMKQAGHFKIELLDKDGQAMSNYDIKGKVTFVSNTKNSKNIPLQPYGRDGFSAKIPQSDFFKYTVTIEILSSPITANFENECAHVTDSK
jgi:hypothetical protein